MAAAEGKFFFVFLFNSFFDIHLLGRVESYIYVSIHSTAPFFFFFEHLTFGGSKWPGL